MAYRMVQLPMMTLSETEGHFCYFIPL